MKVLFFFSGGFDIEHSSTVLMKNILGESLKEDLIVHYIVPNETGNDHNCPYNLKNHKNLTYDVVRRKTTDKSNFIRRYLIGVFYSLKCANKIYNQKDIDVIYIQSTPTAFWNILMSKIFGHRKPIIYSVLDMFPGSTIASGVMPQKLLQKIFYFIQKISYKMSSHIMTMSEDMKCKVQEQGVPDNKITYYNTWFDTNKLKYVSNESNSFIEEFKMNRQKNFYIQYAGNIGYVFDVELFLDVVEYFKSYSDIVFQLVARGSQLEKLMKEAKIRGLNNIQLIPIQPVERINEVYSSCHIQLIPLKKGVMGNSFPSKLAHVMGCKRTFVCSIDRDCIFFNEANKNKIGICCSNDSYKNVVEKIKYLYLKRDILDQCSTKAYQYSKVKFSKEVNTNIIIKQIITIGGN